MDNIVFMDQLTCRTCLSNVEVSNSLNDCVEFDENIELKEILCKVSTVLIDWEKTLQLTRICIECTDKLLKAYEFQTQIVANEKRLHDYFEDARKSVAQDVLKEDEEHHSASPLGSPLNDDFLVEEDNESSLQLKTLKTEDGSPTKSDSIQAPHTTLSIESVHDTPIDSAESTNEEQTEENSTSTNQKTTETKESKATKVKKPRPKKEKKPRKKPRRMEDATFQCETCARKFFSPQTLERHKKSHLGSGSYQCTHCARSFTKKDNLLRHMITHKVSENVPKKHKYKYGLCPHCGESFPAASLIIHIRRHTGETPYKCDICGKGFPRTQDMTLHKRLHTGEKPYVCQTCGKAFSRTNSLTRHIRVHTGERPYKCNQCDKSFAQSNDLNMHIRRHTGEKPYKCNVCNVSFINGSILKNHRRAALHYEENDKGPDRYEKIRVTNPHRACWTTKGDEKKVIDVKDIKELMPVKRGEEQVESVDDDLNESLAICKQELDL